MQETDELIYRFINQDLSQIWLDSLMTAATNRNTWIGVYVLIIIVLFIRYGKKGFITIGMLLLTVGISDRLTSGILKPTFDRVRPCHEVKLTPRVLVNCSDTGSMPSSHASNHFALAVFLVLLAGRKRVAENTVWILWAALIAYSRVYCGVHYPGDVFIGAFLGTLIGFGMFKLNAIILKRIQKE